MNHHAMLQHIALHRNHLKHSPAAVALNFEACAIHGARSPLFDTADMIAPVSHPQALLGDTS